MGGNSSLSRSRDSSKVVAEHREQRLVAVGREIANPESGSVCDRRRLLIDRDADFIERARCAFDRVLISGATGIGPPLVKNAQRRRFKSTCSGRACVEGAVCGELGCGPRTRLYASVRLSTKRAIGPSTAISIHGGAIGVNSGMGPTIAPLSGTVPHPGFSPTTPQKCDGTRIDPPISEPRPSGEKPHASAAASPPLDPPGTRSRFHGLRVAPNTGLSQS